MATNSGIYGWVPAGYGGGIQVAAVDDLDLVVAQCHVALGEFVKGNPEPLKVMYSHQEDVTVANPFGPPVRGWDQVAATMEGAASNYRDGEIVGFENVATYATPELAYIVEVERYKAKVAGREDLARIALRVTSVLRFEGGTWKVVHRHADPITTAQPADSVLEQG